MSLSPAKLAKLLRRVYPKHLLSYAPNPGEPPPEDLAKYRDDPVGFAREILGVELTPDQQRIIVGLPGRVKVNSGHSIGKTMLAAVAVLWWFYTRDPSVVITTAPTKHHVETILWSEVRLLALRAKKKLPAQFLPKAAKIWHHPDHFAEGVTSSSGEGFQGRHRPSMLFIFDECEDVGMIYWSVTDTMYQPGSDHGWLAIGNPLTTTSQSYLEDLAVGPDRKPKWQVHTLSALNHPNITAQLAGNPPPIPNAVTLGQVEQWINDWTTPITPGDQQAHDVEWPPGSNTWYRPGPTFLARVQGIRPTSGVDSVFSHAAWERMIVPKWDHVNCWIHMMGITIGCDPAAYGDDFTAIHVRTGPLSLHHESHNGWAPDKTAGRLKELCREYADLYNSWAILPRPNIKPQDVTVNIEQDGGLGLGVLSHAQDYYRWRGITVGGASQMVDSTGGRMYFNIRSQMWNEAAKKAMGSMMDLSRLPQDVKDRLRTQLLTPFYEIRPDGCRQVESKQEIKKRMGRSPDDADSLLLSHYDSPNYSPSLILKEEMS